MSAIVNKIWFKKSDNSSDRLSQIYLLSKKISFKIKYIYSKSWASSLECHSYCKIRWLWGENELKSLGTMLSYIVNTPLINNTFLKFKISTINHNLPLSTIANISGALKYI